MRRTRRPCLAERGRCSTESCDRRWPLSSVSGRRRAGTRAARSSPVIMGSRRSSGRKRLTAIAARATTTAPTVAATVSPSTNAPLATSSNGVSAGSTPRAMSPCMPPRLPSATSLACSGICASALLIPELYWLVSSDPSTATPSAPPSSRVVSFVAEPIPARSRGTDAMSCVVIGVIVSAMPPESTHIVRTSWR